jgi:pyridoxine 5-phosphate synthase
MRRVTLALHGLAGLRDVTGSNEIDLAAAATLAELAGVDAVRLAVCEDMKPIREEDVAEVRHAARRFELRMPPSNALLRVALEGRPDRVVLAGEGLNPGAVSAPLDLQSRAVAVEPVVRALAEAGIPCCATIGPELDAVKRVHAESIPAVEFYTGGIVDLPPSERGPELEKLSDAVRLAAKLQLEIGLGGGLSYRNLGEVLTMCPAAQWVAVGRAALSRSLLVGLDRALRDLRTRVE